jgi:hypothetical protein
VSRFSLERRRASLPLFCAGLVGLAMFISGLAAEPVQAQASARVDSQIRPCFGLLIEPNLSKGCGGVRRPVRRAPVRRGGRLPPLPFINCDTAYPGQVSEVAAQLYPGDTLTLSSTEGRACVDSLNITQAITIVADSSYQPGLGAPLLIAPPDKPCISIGRGVEYVVLVGLMIQAERAGRESCIVGTATELALDGVVIRYSGDGSALDVSNSRVEMRNTGFIARSTTAAVKVSGTLVARDVTVAATALGFAFEPAADSTLSNLKIVRLGDWTGSSRTRNSAGLILSGMNRSQLIQASDISVDGFSRGIYIGGGDEIVLDRAKVTNSDWAILLEGSTLTLRDAELEAADVGLYVATGQANMSDSKIVGVMRSGVFAERGGQVRSRDNRVYPREGGCSALSSGYFDGALTCRPWFEAPEVYRSASERQRGLFASWWDFGPAPVDLSTAPAPVPSSAPPPPARTGAPPAGTNRPLPKVYETRPDGTVREAIPPVPAAPPGERG